MQDAWVWSAGESFVLQPREEGASWVGTMHQGPHFSLLPSAPWGCRHLGRAALFIAAHQHLTPHPPPPTPTLSTTGESRAGRRAAGNIA